MGGGELKAWFLRIFAFASSKSRPVSCFKKYEEDRWRW